jgi:tRNA(Ile)-lysidine synthetase-like protein
VSGDGGQGEGKGEGQEQGEGEGEGEGEGIPLPWPERAGEVVDLPLPRGGRVRVSRAEAAVVAALARGEHPAGVDGADNTVVAVDRDPDGGDRLKLRYARRGDRMHPFGAPGRRRLSDVLAEAGVPRLRRDRLPVVVGPEGIVWVGGVRTAECGRVRRPDEPALLLEFVWAVPVEGTEQAGGITPSREERP